MSRLPETLFERRLLLVTGKGGVGKTTVAAALAALAARSGKRTLLISTDGRGDAAALFGHEDRGYTAVELEPGVSALQGLTAEFDSLLTDFVRTNVPLDSLSDRLLASATFRYFTSATPGLPELLLLGKVRDVLLAADAEAARAKKGREPRGFELVVMDLPATGHALSLVAMPRTLLRTIPAGPLRRVAIDLDRWLADPSFASLVVVAEPAEFAAREAEEIVAGAKEKAGLETGLAVINRIGRGGAPPSLPRLDLPFARVPELPDEDVRDGPFAAEQRFFGVFLEALQGRAPVRQAALRVAAALPDTLDVATWIGTARLLVLTGPGGVGKTTLAAAAGIAAARAGRRVLVLTVDPARRLAQALGIAGRTDEPTPVKVEGLPAGASLRAMQIDPKAAFERLLSRVASPDVVDRIHRNRLYTGLVDSLPGVLEYMGVEALAEHSRDPDIDLIVLDTPPAARGIDFLGAPTRMVELLEHDALRWFLKSDSLLGRALSGASRGAAVVLKLADRVLGFGFLSDLADFFHAFDGLYDGFLARSHLIAEDLKKGRFLVVSSLDRSALVTAADTAEALKRRGAPVALLVNRVPATLSRRAVLPPALRELDVKSIAETSADAADLPATLAKMLTEH